MDPHIYREALHGVTLHFVPFSPLLPWNPPAAFSNWLVYRHFGHNDASYASILANYTITALSWVYTKGKFCWPTLLRCQTPAHSSHPPPDPNIRVLGPGRPSSSVVPSPKVVPRNSPMMHFRTTKLIQQCYTR